MFLYIAILCGVHMFMQADIKEGQIYQHYKGNSYQILGVGFLTESDLSQKYVVYKSLYEDPIFGYGAIWIRPLNMFIETLEYNNHIVPRFKLVE